MKASLKYLNPQEYKENSPLTQQTYQSVQENEESVGNLDEVFVDMQQDLQKQKSDKKKKAIQMLKKQQEQLQAIKNQRIKRTKEEKWRIENEMRMAELKRIANLERRRTTRLFEASDATTN